MVHLQTFSSGENITISISNTHVTFRWKDRNNRNIERLETLTGEEFFARYLRHVPPRGLRAIRYYGFYHPAAHVVKCPCCSKPMKIISRRRPAWKQNRAPPTKKPTRS